MTVQSVERVADLLTENYAREFGGKASGRYRLPRKFLGDMLGRRRIYDEDIRDVTRALRERGYVLIDMETFFVVISANAFVNYRRVPKE